MKLLARNENATDRVLRVGIGIGLLSLVWLGPKTALGYLGLVPLLTGILGSCPAYSLLGLSTYRAPKP